MPVSGRTRPGRWENPPSLVFGALGKINFVIGAGVHLGADHIVDSFMPGRITPFFVFQ